MKTVIIEVHSTGTVQIETTGFKGNACEKITAEVEKALGVPGVRKKKPEYYVADLAAQQKIGGKR